MNSPQERRLGIDGLSRKSAQPARPQTHHAVATHKVATAAPARLAASSRSAAADDTPIYGAGSLSHPSLPLGHAPLNYKRTSLAKKLAVYPIIQRVDSRVRRLAAAKQALNIRFWLLAVLPFVALITRNIAASSPAEVAASLHTVITSHNYVWFSVAGAVLIIAAVITYVVSALSSQAMLGIKLRSIDHRTSQSQLLLRRGMSNILRTIWNGVLNFGLLVVVTTLLGVVLYAVSSSTVSWVVLSRSLIVSALTLVYLAFLLAVGLRRPMQRAIAASTTKATGFIQSKSWKLVLRPPLLSLVICAFWLLVASLIISLLLALSWAEFVYLGARLGLLSRLAVWLLGLSLVTLVWLAGSIWNQMYWASVYHSLVLRQDKTEVSEYLSAQEPTKFRRWPMLVVMITTIALVGIFSLVMYVARAPITHLAQQIKHAIPTSLSGVIPKIK